MLLASSFVAACSAWLCMAFSTGAGRKHLVARLAVHPIWIPCMRSLALVLATGSFALCVARDGAAFGSLLWLCQLCVGAWAAVLILTLLGERARRTKGRPDH